MLAIMASLLPYLSTRKVVYGGAIIGSGVLGLLALIIYVLTNHFYPLVLEFQIPIIQVIQKLNLPIENMYSFILLTAMFTTAVTVGFCFLNKLSSGATKRFNIFGIIICLISIPISQIGFANMVKSIYPIFGYVGLFQVLMITIGWIFRLENRPS